MALSLSSEIYFVPGAGLEPAQPNGRGILSPLCLPNSTTRANMRRRSDLNRWMTVLQTAPLDHLGTTPNKRFYRSQSGRIYIYQLSWTNSEKQFPYSLHFYFHWFNILA